MKMPDAAFEALLHLFQTNDLTDADGVLAESYRRSGLSPKQYRWDQLYRLPRADRQHWFDFHEIYSSMNDDHIDTALRRIFPRQWSQKD